ncbi:MAG: alpha/beta hydrolase [Bacteroidetes bacterium]|nr:alpha/beta hydrolase [Bacteroidota bacterium]
MKNYLILFAFLGVVNTAKANIRADTLVYRKVGNVSLKAYVFRQDDSKHHPAVLLFHGGAWRIGDATWTCGRAKEFAEKGMVAISVEYRLANNGLTPIDGVEDACAAFAWARKHAKKLGIDPGRVAGYGVSAGGHLVAACATLPMVNGQKVSETSRPDIMLLYSPALNMGHDPYFVSLMAGKADPVSYSPSDFVTKKLPPTMIIQGEADSIVYARDAIAFRDKAVNTGAKCILYLYPGVGHLLTHNLKVQYKDFTASPEDMADAHQKEDNFLISLGYMSK